jgi:hypothetical protein
LEKEKKSDASSQAFNDQDSNRLLILNKSLDDLARELTVKEVDKSKLFSLIQQKKALLNDKMLRKQHDLQINMLE